MANEPMATNDELVVQAVAGDRLALGQLLLLHAASLSRLIDARLPPEFASVASVDDVLQDTFLEAFRSIHNFVPRENGTIHGWLATIAEHQVLGTIDRLRAQKRRGKRQRTAGADRRASSAVDLVELLSDSRNRPSNEAATHEAEMAVRVALAGLPQAQQDAVRLHHLDGKSIAETAAELQRPPGAVRGLLQRARKSLRDTLGRSSRWFYSK
jgi:RNA polymerase sigma-70 factor (ECF subfamily)